MRFNHFSLGLFFLLVLACLLVDETIAQITTTPHNGKRKRILVLGGGGPRGWAHIGVLRWLEQNKIDIDAIVGTSSGALIGTLYAAGRMHNGDLNKGVLDEISNFIQKEVKWDQVISHGALAERTDFIREERQRDASVRLSLQSLGSAEYIEDRIEKAIESIGKGKKNFEDLEGIRLVVVATDLKNKQTVGFESGSLKMALRASISIPIIFPTVEINGRIFVDGGVTATLPTEVARKLAISCLWDNPEIIAVDVAGQPEPISPGPNVLNTLAATLDLLSQRNDEESRCRATILIKPELGAIELLAFDKVNIDDLITKGYEAAEVCGADLAKCKPKEGKLQNDGISLAQKSEEPQKPLFNVKNPFFNLKLKGGGQAYLSSANEVRANAVIEGVIQRVGKENADITFNIGIGSEGRLGVEYDYPIGRVTEAPKAKKLSVVAMVDHLRANQGFFKDTRQEAGYQVDTLNAGISLRFVKGHGAIEGGFGIENLQANLRRGEALSSQQEGNSTYVLLQGGFYTQKNAIFPTEGYRIAWRFRHDFKTFDRNESFTQAEVQASIAASDSKKRRLFTLDFGGGVSSSTPSPFRTYQFGGLQGLSSYSFGEVRGSNYIQAQPCYGRRIPIKYKGEINVNPYLFGCFEFVRTLGRETLTYDSNRLFLNQSLGVTLPTPFCKLILATSLGDAGRNGFFIGCVSSVGRRLQK